MKEIRGYKCDYCGKVYQKKHNAKIHEKICGRNPENHRPCFGCVNLDKKNINIYGYYYDGSEWMREVSLLYCYKKEAFLYTPKNQVKGNQFDLGDYENLPMPKVCDDKIDTMQEYLNGVVL